MQWVVHHRRWIDYFALLTELQIFQFHREFFGRRVDGQDADFQRLCQLRLFGVDLGPIFAVLTGLECELIALSRYAQERVLVLDSASSGTRTCHPEIARPR